MKCYIKVVIICNSIKFAQKKIEFAKNKQWLYIATLTLFVWIGDVKIEWVFRVGDDLRKTKRLHDPNFRRKPNCSKSWMKNSFHIGLAILMCDSAQDKWIQFGIYWTIFFHLIHLSFCVSDQIELNKSRVCDKSFRTLIHSFC